MRPYDAKTEKQIIGLNRDNLSTEGHWILLHGDSVTFSAQRPGEGCTASLSVPRAEFNRIVSWYMRDQKPRKARP